MLKNIIVFFFSYLVFSQEDSSDLNFLYPSENLIIKYHNDWGKENYKKVINEFKKEPLKFNEIIFLGNSITAEGKNWSERFNYPNIRNRGIAGDVTDGVLARIKEIIFFKPRAVFLLIGINDLWNNDSPIVPSPEYVGKNIIKITQIISNFSPNTKIYVQTILPIHKENFRGSINKVNNIIRKSRGKFQVVDLHSIFVNSKGLMNEELTTDGIHLNEKGYEKWVNFVKPILSKVYN